MHGCGKCFLDLRKSEKFHICARMMSKSIHLTFESKAMWLLRRLLSCVGRRSKAFTGFDRWSFERYGDVTTAYAEGIAFVSVARMCVSFPQG